MSQCSKRMTNEGTSRKAERKKNKNKNDEASHCNLLCRVNGVVIRRFVSKMRCDFAFFLSLALALSVCLVEKVGEKFDHQLLQGILGTVPLTNQPKNASSFQIVSNPLEASSEDGLALEPIGLPHISKKSTLGAGKSWWIIRVNPAHPAYAEPNGMATCGPSIASVDVHEIFKTIFHFQLQNKTRIIARNSFVIFICRSLYFNYKLAIYDFWVVPLHLLIIAVGSLALFDLDDEISFRSKVE